MTDHSKAARELYEYAHAEFPACGIAVVPWDDVPEVIRNAWRRALEQAESDALERAAASVGEIARWWAEQHHPDAETVATVLEGTVERIRALKPGGSDG